MSAQPPEDIASDSIQPDDNLPPVEPPSATFLVQLFVIPAIIVFAIVSVWLMFGWIVNRGADRPEAMIAGLEGSGATRWQRASDLADMLRNDRYPEFRRSAPAATQLAQLVERELEKAQSSQSSENSLNLLYFMCRALGEFQVAEGIDTLFDVARSQLTDEQVIARRGAIQAIAVRLYNADRVEPKIPIDASDYEASLIALAEEENPTIRSEVAFTLGRLATPGAIRQLALMVDDPHADARYNAALGLANAGDQAALPTLVEMLEPESLPSVEQESGFEAQLVKRAIIVRNALQGVVAIADASDEVDFAPIISQLEAILALSPEELRQARIDPLLISDVQQTLTRLRP